jgi:hypothetical protein
MCMQHTYSTHDDVRSVAIGVGGTVSFGHFRMTGQIAAT